MSGIRFLAVAAFVGCAISAVAQGFNVDIDMSDAAPYAGGGAPSSSFGAASGQQGFWNSPQSICLGTISLLGLVGNTTPVHETMTGGHTDLAFFNPTNTGDYAALLNDGVRAGAQPVVYTITGLEPGAYAVYVYSVNPNGTFGEAYIDVSGSSEGTQYVSGHMPGNSFHELVTHCVDHTFVTGGTLVISAAVPTQFSQSFINGFQIVPVPEPCRLLAFSAGVAAVMSRKKSARGLTHRRAGRSAGMKE